MMQQFQYNFKDEYSVITLKADIDWSASSEAEKAFNNVVTALHELAALASEFVVVAYDEEALTEMDEENAGLTD